MNEPITPVESPGLETPAATVDNNPGKVSLAIQIDSELLDQISHLTNDPSKVIEVAVRQWLRRGAQRDDDLTRNLRRNPPVPPRGEWND